MPADPLSDLTTCLNPLFGDRDGALQIETRALRGGIDSAGVVHITARYAAPGGKRRSRRLIMKRLAGGQVREARVYEEILGAAAPSLAPSLARLERRSDECWLFLDPVRPTRRWPWRDAHLAAEVLRALARVHSWRAPEAVSPHWLCDWDYEAELAGRAAGTLAALERLPRTEPFLRLRASLGALRRLVAELPEWRRELGALVPFGRTFIHGDVHPGNVMVRRWRGGTAPVLLDWGRSRIGSPLEDVSSWLQSLGYWEPVARRWHDSLFQQYLEARGFPRQLTRPLRDAYWLAAASNLLAGAILVHVSRLAEPDASLGERTAAFRAAADCLRVIRRADACWAGRVAARTTVRAGASDR